MLQWYQRRGIVKATVGIGEEVRVWLAQQSVAAYLVGGNVRDRLLGRSSYDLDFAVDGHGLELARRLANHFRGAYHPLDTQRGTGRAILPTHGDRSLVVDIARFRGKDLSADLADRDFTVNALAAAVQTPDSIIDHHGGLADLEARLIRPVSEASIRNDPLRALRAVRQSAELGFSLTAECEGLIRRDGPALAQVAGERIADEVARLLAWPNAAPHLEYADRLGLLTTVVPELEPLRGAVQPPPHHLDMLGHSLQTIHCLEALLDNLLSADGGQFTLPNIQHLVPFADPIGEHLGQIAGDVRTRLITLKLAALLHDAGKPEVRTADHDGRHQFIGHERRGAETTGKVLRQMRFTRTEVRLGETIVRHHMRPLLLAGQETVSSRAIYRFFRDTRQAGIEVLLHALADHQATYADGAQDKRWPRLVALTARMLADYWERQAERIAPPRLIDGHELMRVFGLQPGPHVGALLEAVREAQVSGEIRTRDEALALAQKELDASS
jgi:tRNA nucleotidyltransferase/poly(A) polymerase